MLSRPGALPSGSGWSFELKCDGFRALVSTEDGFRVRSRRGWNMTPVLPEFRGLPRGLVLGGELVAWRGGVPYFPLVCNLGLEGIVAKKLSSRYQPNERGWIKLKNPNYWRRDAEREALARKHEHRVRTRV